MHEGHEEIICNKSYVKFCAECNVVLDDEIYFLCRSRNATCAPLASGVEGRSSEERFGRRCSAACLTSRLRARKVVESFCSDSLQYHFATGSVLNAGPCKRSGDDERASRATAVSGPPAVLPGSEIRRAGTGGAGRAEFVRGSLETCRFTSGRLRQRSVECAAELIGQWLRQITQYRAGLARHDRLGWHAGLDRQIA